LIAGIALTRAVAARMALSPSGEATRVTLKWPNDVLIDGLKVAGLLAELLPEGEGVVVGAGLNLTIAASDLPTPTATSLMLGGARIGGVSESERLAGGIRAPEGLVDAVLAEYLGGLRRLYEELLAGGRDGIRRQLRALCSTLGKQVRVQLPGDRELAGTAVDVDETGRLCVKSATDGRLQAVAAGDVTHVR
jgi:BirA family biotin operon repressor/biotin-[acetyl-CoA-carboxylase] ligase